jgi:hypothetical protein
MIYPFFPIYGGSAGVFLSVLITFNFLFFLYYGMRTIVYYFKVKPGENENKTFWNYVIWDDFDSLHNGLIGIAFCVVNGIALIIMLCLFVMKFFHLE